MKVFVLLVSAVVMVATESPVYYTNFLRFQRVEQAPYPAAGYRPDQEYRLPERQGYAPPQPAYGLPSPTTTEALDTTTTEIPTTVETATEQEPEQIKQGDNERGNISEEEFTEQGAYYIYHPNGLLQRVVYSTRNDVQDMGYTAQLRYRDVEPIKDPIYTYDPENFVLRQIQLSPAAGL